MCYTFDKGEIMNLHHIFTDPPILIVLTTFILSVTYCLRKYINVNKNLKLLLAYLSTFSKSDLNFRFKEMDEWMSANPYVSASWAEFKNTLVFSESVALKTQDNNLTYQDVSSTVQTLQTTVDPLYFFNEETLITSKYNAKLIGALPTILTGCGPLFTFLNIAIAFGKIDFSTQERTIASVSGLMNSMQVAALVSVFAVGASLIFIVIEKFSFSLLCSSLIGKIEDLIGRLFDNVSSEKFLFELLKETKIQNNSMSNLMVSMPNSFKVALNAGIAGNLVPYLENLIFGLNQMNKELKEGIRSGGGDDVDGLF